LPIDGADDVGDGLLIGHGDGDQPSSVVTFVCHRHAIDLTAVSGEAAIGWSVESPNEEHLRGRRYFAADSLPV
jgi:hypothetical protein